jgi:nucleotide-binding universal stress UspA family protein
LCGITVASEGCDLIAMGGHGHRLLADLFLGSAVESVRHRATVPILIVGPKTENF